MTRCAGCNHQFQDRDCQVSSSLYGVTAVLCTNCAAYEEDAITTEGTNDLFWLAQKYSLRQYSWK